MAFLNNGLVYPEVGTACELGFGQGLSTNIHAAASVTKWYGNDFNPAQASYAKELAEKSGADATLYDDSFEDFLNRQDLPDFDYIGLHGIWSWVSDENRSIIVEFIRRKLKVGGVVYISYNTLPGWAAFAPMRHLMTEHAEVLGCDGQGIVSRINDAIQFADKFMQINPGYFLANPLVGQRLELLKSQNRQYLAHEYFNRDWVPMHFSTVAEQLNRAKLQFACSAHYLDHIEALNLSANQLSFLNELPSNRFVQSLRDYIVNQQFRRDYWVKGIRKFDTRTQIDNIRKLRIVLVVPRADVALKAKGDLGESTLSVDIYNPILESLEDNRPKTIAAIEKKVLDYGISFHTLFQAVMILAGKGDLHSAHPDEVTDKCRVSAQKLNLEILRRSKSSGEFSALASPVSGAGISVSRFNQIFLLGYSEGCKSISDLSEFALKALLGSGQKILLENQPIDSEADSLVYLTKEARLFQGKYLNVYNALQLVP